MAVDDISESVELTLSGQEIPYNPGFSASDDDAGGEIQNKLIEPDRNYWRKRSAQERQVYVNRIEKQFKELTIEFVNNANTHIKLFKNNNKKNTYWRFSLIVLTGGLAAINIIVASPDALIGSGSFFAKALPVMAAVYASLLAMLQSLESFFQHNQKAAVNREARELYLDAARDLRCKWESYVGPFGNTATACLNAKVLYDTLTERDRELRLQVKDITDSQGKKE